MTRSLLLFAALALAACAPSVPDSGAGVGFQDYQDYSSYRSQRDDVLNGNPPTTVTPNPAPAAAPAATPTATTTPPVGGTPGTNAPATGPVVVNNPSISDENDFGAVSNRQTIESDAARLRAQREAFKVVEPTAVPTRTGNTGPNIVQYALSTSNPRGQKVYRRSIVSSQKKFDRNCAGYVTADLAQEAFLKAGGPERDKLGLDPDGDGFACAWDPTPFRRLAANR